MCQHQLPTTTLYHHMQRTWYRNMLTQHIINTDSNSQGCGMVPIDNLRVQFKELHIQSEQVASLCANVEMATMLRETARGDGLTTATYTHHKDSMAYGQHVHM